MSEKEKQGDGKTESNELEVETLSREDSKLLSEYAKLQKDLKSTGDAKSSEGKEEMVAESGNSSEEKCTIDSNSRAYLTTIVLKFTTLSEGALDPPSFTIGTSGARIGRDPSNEVYVPSDQRLAPRAHSTIEFSNGSFFIEDGGYEHSLSLRIGMGQTSNKKWWLYPDARFSAGNSVFKSDGVDADGNLLLSVIDGPLKGENRQINRSGATFGRSSENTVSIPDRELSRKHSKIEYDESSGKYLVGDLGSTNGTYMQLVGPYGGRYELHLNDLILVGRTGFSINRFDYGVSEEIGHRQTMEDAVSIIQHLSIPSLKRGLSPQSFFAVFDGHGGSCASHYLSQNLHSNIVVGLTGKRAELRDILDSKSADEAGELLSDGSSVSSTLDEVVTSTLKSVFLATDNTFINTSNSPSHGSTATTALILGHRIYCANVGDSRTFLCRDFTPFHMSQDHKPSREDESKRIRDAGGFVINHRVMGELAVSRAFGDCDFKKGIQSILDQEEGEGKESSSKEDESYDLKLDQPLIIAEPDFVVTSYTSRDQFLLLACDGLFDVLTAEEIIAFVKVDMEEHGDPQRCCKNLTHEAIRKRNSRDNVSVILVILNKWYSV